MAGLLAGIMLARPVALFISGSFGWRAVFWSSAGLMVIFGLALARLMPRHVPRAGLHYGQILVSMARLLRTMPALRRRAAYQALMFCAFNIFWTVVPIMLMARFKMGEYGIGLFALAGAGGALAAPIAGRLADSGFGRAGTLAAMVVLGLSFYCTQWATGAQALGVLVVLTVLIDATVQTNHIISQHIIFSVPAEIRGRVNAIYMTLLFMGGAVGSVLGTIIYHWGGWNALADVGGLIGILMLLLFATECHREVIPHE